MATERNVDDTEIAALVEHARAVREKAYAPYSDFPVGAALLTSNGEIYSGVNIENASYPATVCAERVAIFTAVATGARDIVALAVVTRGAGSPCGICRQVLAEFGTNITVIIAHETGTVREVTTISLLLPDSFGPNNLKRDS